MRGTSRAVPRQNYNNNEGLKKTKSHLCAFFACNLPRGEGEATDAGVFFSVISAELNNGARATGAGFDLGVGFVGRCWEGNGR